MQIMIDIPKDTFEKIREFDGKHDVLIDRGKLYEAIQNGTSLPKRHGRLIDADVLVDGMEDDYEFCEAVNATPTIIEADKR
jgi:hypothetical protein